MTADATPAWFGKTPDRAVVDRAWVAVAEGALTREVVHEWTVPWVERTAERTDVMVYRGMTYLHGFDLVMSDPARPNLSRHGGPGMYRKSLDEIQKDLDRWRTDCVEYDADPKDWLNRKLALASAAASREQERDPSAGG